MIIVDDSVCSLKDGVEVADVILMFSLFVISVVERNTLLELLTDSCVVCMAVAVA